MKTPTNKLSVQSAFSLVELLVVIAVIAVIAAIAIPNIAGITGSAKEATRNRNAQTATTMFGVYVVGAEASTNYPAATLAADRATVATAIAALAAGRTVIDNFGKTNTYSIPLGDTSTNTIASDKMTMTDGNLSYTP